MSETIGGSLQGDPTSIIDQKGQQDQKKKRKEDGTPLADNGHDGIETVDRKRSRAPSMIHLIACFFLIGAREVFDG